MTDRELTPAEAEAVAYLKAEIERRLAGQPVTRATFTAAAINVMRDIAEPFPPINVERDPADPNRLIFTGPGIEALRQAAGVAPIEPHHYQPSAMHMGDCMVCGHLATSPVHIEPAPTRSRDLVEIMLAPQLRRLDFSAEQRDQLLKMAAGQSMAEATAGNFGLTADDLDEGDE